MYNSRQMYNRNKAVSFVKFYQLTIIIIMDKYQEKYQKTVKIVDYIFNVLFVINIIFMLIAYSQ